MSSKLPVDDRLLIEGGYRETTRDWAGAVETYRKLFVLYPDMREYGIRLTRAQASAGMGKDALVTVDALRKLSSPARDDPSIDLAEAFAASALSDFTRQQEAAARAARRGEALGARILVAEARASQGLAFWSRGQLPQARTALEEAKRVYASVRDRGGVADTVNDIANVLSDQGDVGGAQTMYEAAATSWHSATSARNSPLRRCNLWPMCQAHIHPLFLLLSDKYYDIGIPT